MIVCFPIGQVIWEVDLSCCKSETRARRSKANPFPFAVSNVKAHNFCVSKFYNFERYTSGNMFFPLMLCSAYVIVKTASDGPVVCVCGFCHSTLVGLYAVLTSGMRIHITEPNTAG